MSEVLENDTTTDPENLSVVTLGRIWDTVQCLDAQNGTENGPYENVTEVKEKLLPVQEWLFHNKFADILS